LSAFLAGTEKPTQSVFLAAVDILIEYGGASQFDDLASNSRSQADSLDDSLGDVSPRPSET
jgi:hypothetical protein